MINNKINVSLSKDLRKKYGIRRFPISKGDVVTIISGSRKGEGGKVIDVNHKNKKISIEGITIAKADGKQVAYYVDHSNLQITRLDLSRTDRQAKLREITAARNLPPPEPEEIKQEETTETVTEGGESEKTAEDEGSEEEINDENNKDVIKENGDNNEN
ncbi:MULTISPECIES: 50S ribosomal protein L24 [Acidiplasma]|jgi:large subunit ribosomal protein L24|uniref:50S ribosomal protein L24 n=2 Tax=Acidiplasma TaxID=507753 RepID=A0A0N8VL48_9ARCH|nr:MULTISPECIES: 50S ribosomal protein L24 [Acidiplasma]KJE49460.1 50S ribosomal protein L24 [Acidiplasma sp. MBA-1]KPV46392.1 50S ribosomal protein L24 [Acidiplasma aeolicum]KQB35524.1 50S ribosomal protein L24 [Acidiplasma cupricumulans]KQB36726.1 50S ribosomal protein L24 [Acidiplasma aeolicum]WMT54561.1 MAG: 50S ribosomal protein L24 [Acidiplasma sp.]